ncbi:MAG: hypothetical protein ACJ8H8_07450, partial [Geminicoccaceae bacterium]
MTVPIVQLAATHRVAQPANAHGSGDGGVPEQAIQVALGAIHAVAGNLRVQMVHRMLEGIVVKPSHHPRHD